MAAPNSRPDDVGAVRLGTDGGRAAAPAHKRPWWLLALLGLLLLGLLLFALSRCGNDDETDSASTAASAAPSAVASAAPSTAPSATASSPAAGASGSAAGSGAAAGAGGAGTGSLTAAGVSLLPLSAAAGSGGDLSKYTSQPARATGVLVESVPADEGFWVGSGPADRVWVQLTGTAGESPFQVKVGQRVDFTGTVSPNPAGYAQTVGVDAAEGAAQLTAERQHIVVDKSTLKLTG